MIGDNMKEHIKKYQIFILIFIVIVSSILISLFDQEPPLPQKSINEEIKQEEKPTYIYIDLKGEVINPGVYKVESNTRLYQLIHMAGGLTQEADTLRINLSITLFDEDVIYIPNINDDPSDNPIIDPQDERIDINRASFEQLQTLPGIGPTTAQNIIDYRNEVGYFETIEDIKNVSGIGEATFNTIKDLIKP